MPNTEAVNACLDASADHHTFQLGRHCRLKILLSTVVMSNLDRPSPPPPPPPPPRAPSPIPAFPRAAGCCVIMIEVEATAPCQTCDTLRELGSQASGSRRDGSAKKRRREEERTPTRAGRPSSKKARPSAASPSTGTRRRAADEPARESAPARFRVRGKQCSLWPSASHSDT